MRLKKYKINMDIVSDDMAQWWGEDSSFSPSNMAEIIADANGEDFILEINSLGGVVSAQWDIINQIIDYPGRITTVVTGTAASSAAMIYLYGDERKVYNLAELMFHRSSAYVVGNAPELKRFSKMLNSLDELAARKIAEVCDISKSKALAKMTNDWYITGGEEILKNGLADEIIAGQKAEAKAIHSDRGAAENSVDLERAVAIAGGSIKLKGGPKKMKINGRTTGSLTAASPAGVPQNVQIAGSPQADERAIAAVNAAVAEERSRIMQILAAYDPDAAKALQDPVDTGQDAGAYALAELERLKALAKKNPSGTPTAPPAPTPSQVAGQAEPETEDIRKKARARLGKKEEGGK